MMAHPFDIFVDRVKSFDIFDASPAPRAVRCTRLQRIKRATWNHPSGGILIAKIIFCHSALTETLI